MTVNIETATIGYDKAGLVKLKELVRTEVIDQACTELDTSFTNLETAMKEVWVGNSADMFMKNMRADVDGIRFILQATQEAIEGVINGALSKMATLDDILVEGVR